MWISSFTQGSSANSRWLAKTKGLLRMATAIVSTGLAVSILLACALLPLVWEESSDASPLDRRAISEPIYDLVLSEDENLLVVRTMHSVLFRDLATGSLIQEIPIGSDMTSSVAWSPITKSLLVGKQKGPIAEWRWDKGNLSEHKVHSAHQQEVLGFALTNDGRCLATLSSDRVCLWDLANGTVLAQASMGGLRAGALHFSPDDALLLVGCDDGSLRLFSTDDLQQCGQYRLVSSPVVDARFIRGGRQIFSAHRSGRFSVIDRSNGKEIRRGQTDPWELVAAAISPDERLVAASFWDKTIYLFDLESLEKVATLKGHKLPVASLQFTKSSDRLYSAGHEGTIRAWDTRTFAELDCYVGALPTSSD